MSLRTIILGLLDTPASGYDLRKLFEESVRHFWKAELSQIYPTLHQLEKDGLVRVTLAPSRRGPKRKVYERTSAGTDELRAWIAGGPTLDTDRHTWLAQVFFLDQYGDMAQKRRFLESLRLAFTQRLQVLEAIDAAERAGHDLPPDLDAETLTPYLTLRCGIRRLAATVEWCDESIALLDRLEAGRVDTAAAKEV